MKSIPDARSSHERPQRRRYGSEPDVRCSQVDEGLQRGVHAVVTVRLGQTRLPIADARSLWASMTPRQLTGKLGA